MQRLYEIVKDDRQTFNRTQAIRYYKAWNIGRKEFGLFVSSLKRNKVDYASVQNLRHVYITNKEEFRSRINFTPYYLSVVRKLRGQVIRVNLATEGADRYKEAMQSMRLTIQRIRRESKSLVEDRLNRGAGYWLKKYQERVFSTTKRPTTKADFTGIEIECVMPADADFKSLMPFAKWINIGTDGSIDAKRHEEGREIRVCIERENIREVLPALTDALKSLGAYVNKSCGLHVHLDQRNEKQPDLIFAKLVRSLGLLYRVVPASRRKNNYCKRNRRTDFNMAVNGERYKAINATAYHRYKTLEVRLFGGTLDSTKMINWIETLWAIVKGEMLLRCPRSFDAAAKHWNLSPENLAWLKEREIKFANLNTSPVNESDDEERPDDEGTDECLDCGESPSYCECDQIEEEAA